MKVHVYHHFCTTDPGLAQLLAGVNRLEKLLMNQTEAISKLETAFQGMKTAVADGVANITGDIKGLQDQLTTLTDLTPENQAKVDEMVAGFQSVADQVTALANIVPDKPAAEV